MKDLFAVGLNQSGFFVYPNNNPPDPQKSSSGDEVSFKQASDLCGSLNASVQNYIAQIARDNSKELLQAIAKHWSWIGMLRLVRDLIWNEVWNRREEGYAVPLRKNCLDLGRLIRDWR